MADHYCRICRAGLKSDEIALHMKMFSRASTSFMCLDCQAAYLRVNRGSLEKIIERYHKTGTCALFAKYS